MTLYKSFLAAFLAVSVQAAPLTAATESHKDIMEAAAAACEDMVDAVASNGMSAAQTKITDLRAALKKAHGFLKADVVLQLDSRADEIAALAKSDSKTRLSLAAIETFKDIVSAADWQKVKVPKDVSMLDYTGFKLGILAADANTDWAEAAKTADEAHRVWEKLIPAFKDEDLVDLAHTLDDGTLDAVKRQDALGLKFATKLQLVSIDLIETSFTSKSRP